MRVGESKVHTRYIPSMLLVLEHGADVATAINNAMKAIAEKANLEVEFVNTGFDSVLAGISECQYELAIAAITITVPPNDCSRSHPGSQDRHPVKNRAKRRRLCVQLEAPTVNCSVSSRRSRNTRRAPNSRTVTGK